MLETIPFHDLRSTGPAGLAEREPARLADLLHQAQRTYSRLGLKLGEKLSVRWLRPLLAEPQALPLPPIQEELAFLDRQLGMPGATALNLSYEWACTVGLAPLSAGHGVRLLRTLDWALDGLGRCVAVAQLAGPAGDYHAVTWPGFLGVLTAMAPGRFSVALNQPPLRQSVPSGLGPVGMAWDWLVERRRVGRSRGLPPAWVLRQVCEQCATAGEALEYLQHVPLCVPALFTLAPADKDEGWLVERLPDRAALHQGALAVANHWQGLGQGLGQGLVSGGWARGRDSEGRAQRMQGWVDTGEAAAWPLDDRWVVPPILDPTTRLAVVAEAGPGRLFVRGYENERPATEPFFLEESPS